MIQSGTILYPPLALSALAVRLIEADIFEWVSSTLGRAGLRVRVTSDSIVTRGTGSILFKNSSEKVGSHA